MNTTLWYKSKTLWVNLIAIIALAIQTINSGYVISPEIQAGILAIINLILRTVTNQPLDWGAPANTADGEPPHFIPPGNGGYISGSLALALAISLFTVLMLCSGCATTSPNQIPPSPPLQSGELSSPPLAKGDSGGFALAGKSLLAVKSTIVTAATATDAFCKAGKISADKCAQAKVAYELAKPAYDAAVDSYLLMSSQGGDPGDFGRALARVQDIAANLLILSGGAN